MKIARATGKQTFLFKLPDPVAKNNVSHKRNVMGTMAQDIVCEALDLFPISTNGNYDACFDAEKDGRFYEIKSVHSRSTVVIYNCRINNEIRANVNLTYAIFVHDKSLILLIPSPLVYALALQVPLRYVKTERKRGEAGATGYNRKGYCEGYFLIRAKHLCKLANRLKSCDTLFLSPTF